MSLFGVKWSITMLTFSGQQMQGAFAPSNTLTATGEVMSLPSTMSSSASISWPAFTLSKCACAARIFCDIVIPIVRILLFQISMYKSALFAARGTKTVARPPFD